MAHREIAYDDDGRGILLGGGLAGLGAGVVMLIACVAHAASSGLGAGLPIRLVAAQWYGLTALVAGADAIVVGLLTHLAVSALWGMILAALLRDRPGAAAAVGYGLGFGIGVWAVMTYLVLPLNPTMRDRVVGLTPGWWFVAHLVFGGTLALTPRLYRAVASRPAAVQAPPVRRAA